jgi:uncharacterized protein YjlB
MPPPEVQRFCLRDQGDIPNHPDLPLLFLPQAMAAEGEPAARARAIEAAYRRHGWQGLWRWGVYPFAHYHSTAHEVLTCFQGWANLRLGGDNGVTIAVRPGDAVIIPAGVGHQNLGGSEDFQVCGAYPPGQDADLIRADETDRHVAARARIRHVPVPEQDPLFGRNGPLVTAWSGRAESGA